MIKALWSGKGFNVLLLNSLWEEIETTKHFGALSRFSWQPPGPDSRVTGGHPATARESLQDSGLRGGQADRQAAGNSGPGQAGITEETASPSQSVLRSQRRSPVKERAVSTQRSEHSPSALLSGPLQHRRTLRSGASGHHLP